MSRIPRLALITALLAVAILLIIFAYRALLPVRISLELAEKAPLSAEALIKTRRPTELTLRIAGRDNNDLHVQFSGFSRRHRVPVLGLYPDHENRIEFELRTADGETHRRSRSITTAALPDAYPEIEIRRQLPDRIAPGMIFMHLGHYDEEGDFQALPSAIDLYGRVRWFYDGDIGHVLKRLENGHLLIQDTRDKEIGRLAEIDLLGRRIAERAEVQTGIHHDACLMPNGNILALTSAEDSFEDGVVEIDGQSGEVLRGWDLRTILAPGRPPQPRNLEEEDWLHLNGIDYNPGDDSMLLSGRDQSAVVKIHRARGRLQWILGNHRHWPQQFQPYLLEPDGSVPFEWPWGQHAPMFHPDNPQRVLIYDNGNRRSYDTPLPPQQNYSRAVEYEIDPGTMQVRRLWEFGRRYGSELYTPFIGDANYLPGGNRLLTFGGITRSLEGRPMEIFDFEQDKVNRMKISARIIEVTADLPAREVLHISLADPDPDSYRGYRCYRAVKMPLYP